MHYMEVTNTGLLRACIILYNWAVAFTLNLEDEINNLHLCVQLSGCQNITNFPASECYECKYEK